MVSSRCKKLSLTQTHLNTCFYKSNRRHREYQTECAGEHHRDDSANSATGPRKQNVIITIETSRAGLFIPN